MGFEFNHPDYENTYKSLSSLVKYNNGIFKSAKQAAFLLKTVFHKISTVDQIIDYHRFFGIDVSEGQYVIRLEASMRWVDYGSRSIIPIDYIFIADEFGIIKQYKLPYDGNLRDGAKPASRRIKTLWTRPTDVVLPVFETTQEVKKDIPVSQFIGKIGERVQFTGTVKSIRTFEGNRFHHYDSGIRSITTVMVGNDIVIYWNVLGDAEEGDTVIFVATIKEHSDYKGVNQTTVARASKINVMKKEVIHE